MFALPGADLCSCLSIGGLVGGILVLGLRHLGLPEPAGEDTGSDLYRVSAYGHTSVVLRVKPSHIQR